MTMQYDDRSGGFTGSAPAASPRGGAYDRALKRAFDIAVVLMLSPIVLPVMALLLMAVSVEGGSPIYRSARIGRGGRVFGMLKLRTMRKNSGALLARRLADDPAARREWDATQKLRDDPRVTRLGRLLRATSLDELPQFWNVLTGEMSLVGPRPMLPEQRRIYPGRAYFDMRPGLTGPWQVSDRNRSAFGKRAEFDNRYRQTMSFAGDLRILAQTVAVVARATGY